MVRILALGLLLLLEAGRAWALDPRSEAALSSLLAELTNAPSRAEVRDFVLSPWAAAPSPKLWIGAALVAGELRVGLFQEEEAGLRLIGRSTGVEPLGQAPLDDRMKVHLALDLIPYRIRLNEVAFGVVVESDLTMPGRHRVTKTLELYRYQSDVLSPIFAGVIERSHQEQDLAQASNGASAKEQGETRKFNILITHKETEGLFDLLLREEGSGKAVRYAWMGRGYGAVEGK
ncbi:MAG TPA: hypothetical protein VKT70_01680 [Stellaceae bacterium]|nr:hypothetical protein [Stellaceae bacterium]